MVKKVDLQERLNMRFLTVSYKDKQETYGTSSTATDTGSIALDILNLPDSVLEELLEYGAAGFVCGEFMALTRY